jgi:hypothetical protein
VSDPFALPQRLVVSPPLDAPERALVAGLDLWPGRPRGRSPWTLCDQGCCLDLATGTTRPAALDWLRFWMRELLSPRSTAARERAAAAGLVDHRVDGRVLVGAHAPVLLAVAASRVREVRLDDELFPVEEKPRSSPAVVVELSGHRTER